MHVSEIWIYPVKSLAGVRLTQAEVRFAGLKYDRQWMVVDSDGLFLTQRQLPEMTLIDVSMLQEGMRLSGSSLGAGSVLIPFEAGETEVLRVRVWNDLVEARTVNHEVDSWLTQILKHETRLVQMDEEISRRRASTGSGQEATVRFSDDSPYHLTCQSSLDELNGRLDEKVSMGRFRPNIVVSGSMPYDEDQWKRIRIGEITFELTSRCKRCALVNVNPASGIRERQPLKTLATFRKEGYQVYFGQNLVAMHEGIITEGDQVAVLD